MQTIQKKLSSRRGASLTFALLIFLVCAVVGSVVLTAGTAAAGRMSKITEMDQRYYSVNSASKLLIDMIDGKTVTIIETKPKGTGNRTYEYEDGKEYRDDSFDSIVKEAADYYIKNVAVSGGFVRKGLGRYALALTVGENTDLNAVMNEEIKDDGSMVLTVENAVSDKQKDVYAMELSFSADIKKSEDVQDKQTVTTWKITWNIQNVKIVGGNLRVKES